MELETLGHGLDLKAKFSEVPPTEQLVSCLAAENSLEQPVQQQSVTLAL